MSGSSPSPEAADPESARLDEDAARSRRWKLWGTYLSERQWGTVREDYSASGDVWSYFPHDHARSRAYRWGEDGLLGFTDEHCRLCFAPALWNGRDAILKERLFGLSGPEGNHGEDVKELYYYLDATPTHSYCKALYKYPQGEFPYARLVEENRRRGRDQREFEIGDSGAFDGNLYFDVFIEYVKAAPDDVLIRITVANRGPQAAVLHVLPSLWFRNTWSWGAIEQEATERPRIDFDAQALRASHATLGQYLLRADPACGDGRPLFTENETNDRRLFGAANSQPWVKDAFHAALIQGQAGAVNPALEGTKAALHYELQVPAHGERVLRLRLTAAKAATEAGFGESFEQVFAQRIAEADAYYAKRIEPMLDPARRHVARSALAGLLWSKQFYNLIQSRWRSGDPAPPRGHAARNRDWEHFYARDVLSMPDKWEFPYFCAWDLAFHCVSLNRIDPVLAKHQLILLMREWYMHRNGKLPAYEFAFSDVNPPVQCWAIWRIYRNVDEGKAPDRAFLERCFQKLLLNFTWWVNRQDKDGNNLFGGGFLGLDNIGVFDRSKPLPQGGALQQADGTAWMAFYCVHMLIVSLELAREDAAYEDLASKFLEHFGAITQAINYADGRGLWDEQDGFYYDRIRNGGDSEPLRVRSIVGFVPMFAATLVRGTSLKQFSGFVHRAEWDMKYRPLLSQHLLEVGDGEHKGDYLLSIPSRAQLESMLRYLFDEKEFLSPYGIRSLSKVHEGAPYSYHAGGETWTVDYEPGEGTTGMFGGNSNWRGPVWFPINYLILESLRVYHRYYGDTLQVEFPTGSGRKLTLGEAGRELSRRLQSLFLPDPQGRRPCHGDDVRYAEDPAWKDLLLFNEYYHADSGRGCGASHQTGWTALIADLLNLESYW